MKQRTPAFCFAVYNCARAIMTDIVRIERMVLKDNCREAVVASLPNNVANRVPLVAEGALTGTIRIGI